MKKLVRNAIRCKHCGDVIESKSIHDFKWCSCESVFVDGGIDYLRRGFKTSPEEDYEDMSEYEDVPGYHVEYKSKLYQEFGGHGYEADFPEELDKIYRRFPPEDYYLLITDEDGNVIFDTFTDLIEKNGEN